MDNRGELVHGLREQIVDRLRNDVLSGRLVQGQRISESSLAARFRVSRTPIREALLQLTQEGLLEARPNCGVRVAPDASDAIRQFVIPIRRTIELFALSSFFDDLGDEDFRQWQEILDRLETACEARDYPAIAEQDIAFHRSIIRRAGMPDLEAIWSAIVARVRSHFRLTQQDYSDPKDIHAEHVAIVEAFRTGDLEAAAEALGANIE